jgi:P4 family phage/plasmid primase-like protien
MALKNSGYSCELWDEWSRKSSKYKSGECYKKWATFDGCEKPLTKASLYKWLKEDDYNAFLSLKASTRSLQENLIGRTHAGVAEVFYAMNPDKYMFSSITGWYQLQPDNTWLATGSKDILSIPNIFNQIRGDCLSIANAILPRLNTKNEMDNAMSKCLFNTISSLSNAGFLKGVLSFLPGLYHVVDAEKRFNQQTHLFAFTNGVMDMQTHEFRAIEPHDYISVTCGYPYRASTEAEKGVVREFLAKIFPAAAVSDYVLKALSTTFEGTNRNEFFHIFTGLGANGKSCLMDLCKVVFGNYFQTISVSYLTKDDDGKKDRPLPELVAAIYARMLVSSEPDAERDRFQVALLKLITGGDPISCRGMYAHNAVQFVPQFKLWILANDIPRLSKYDQGIQRRMRCVHFPTRFVSNPVHENECMRDNGLKDKILHDEAWRYGFLGLLLDAARVAGGAALEMPAEVRRCTEEYMLENNPVGAWLRKYYEQTGSRGDIVQKSELYAAFLADTGVRKTQKEFSGEILKSNVGEKVVHGVRQYYGLLRKEIVSEEE